MTREEAVAISMLREPAPSIAGGNGTPIALDAALKRAESVLEH